jgi:hypothetical protein
MKKWNSQSIHQRTMIASIANTMKWLSNRSLKSESKDVPAVSEVTPMKSIANRWKITQNWTKKTDNDLIERKRKKNGKP